MDTKIHILFGPPKDRCKETRMLSLFLSGEGKHVVCGGTTSVIVAKYLGKPVKASLTYEQDDVPPIAEIEGMDLVTEGVFTMQKVVEYAKKAWDKKQPGSWSIGNDSASLLWQILFESEQEIHFYVGNAVNPAHQNFREMPTDSCYKMKLVEELSACLKRMGKQVTIQFF